MVTEKSLENLKLGRQKGTNHLMGIPKSASHRNKMRRIMREWCKNNPEKVKARGKKIRGANHYRWKGGKSKLNISIRTMTENRKWMDAVKKRDGKCRLCESEDELEADHIIPLALILKHYQIKNRNDARQCRLLWDIKNGITLCRRCHYKKDNRKYSKNGYGRRATIRKNAARN